MVDAVDRRRAVGDEPGDHEARGRAKVGRHHVRAGEPRHAAHDRRRALDLDVGAEALQLLHVHHAVLEDRLGDHRGAAGARRERHELRLHVGRERRVRRGAQARRRELALARDPDRVRGRRDRRAGLGKLVDDRLERRGARAGERRRRRRPRPPRRGRSRSRCGRA
jgi:hypothetical protein